MAKKIISLLILVAMLCGFATMPAVTAEENNEKIGEYLELLVNIGAIDESYMSVALNGNVTRGEFAQIVHKYLKVADLVQAGRRAFLDVAEDNQYFTAIESLAKTNIIEGHGMNMYHPDNNVTWDQAATVLVRATGWESEVQKINGMSNYYVIACSRDIFKTPGAQNEAMTYADVFRVLYDTLSADYNQLVSVGPNGANYEFEENADILSEIYDVYKSRGFVTANEFTTLDPDDAPTSDGHIRIDDEEYAASGCADLLGYNVEFYYMDTDFGFEIVQISILNSKNDVEKIYSWQDLRYESGAYRYVTEPSHKKESIQLKSDVVILYNDKLVTNADISEKMIPQNGYIEIIENTKYQILKIYDSKNIVVGSLNKEILTIYDKRTGESYSLKPDDKTVEDYQIVLADGSEITFEEIKRDQAIAIFESLDGEFVKMSVCDEALNASITAIDETSEGRTILELKDAEFSTVKEYRVATNLITDKFNILDFYQLKVGSVAKFVLDPGGNIIDCVADSSDKSGEYRLGYAYNFVMLDDSENSKILMSVYDVDTQTINKYQSTNKPAVNGKRLRDTKLAYIRYLLCWGDKAVEKKKVGDEEITNEYTSKQLTDMDEESLRLIKAEPMLIQYKLSADGLYWDEVMQAYDLGAKTDEKGSGFVRIFNGVGKGTQWCKTAKKLISGKIAYTNNTKMLEVPRSDHRNTASKYILSGSSYFQDNSGYTNLEAYSFTDSKYTVDIVINVDRSEPGASAKPNTNGAREGCAIFNKFTVEVDEEDEIVTYANFYNAASATKYKDTYNLVKQLADNQDLDFGDLVQYKVNGGAIVEARLYYDADKDLYIHNNNPEGSFTGYHRYGLHAIENIKSGTAMFRSVGSNGIVNNSDMELIPTNIFSKTIVDLENRTVYAATDDDIITIEHSPTNFTRLFMHLELGSYGKLYLYNR